jgi:ribonuclease HI
VYRSNEWKTDEFSLVISFDGACRGNGTDNAHASYGVYLGPDSPQNEGGVLSANLAQTSQLAELYSVTKAVYKAIELTESDMRKNTIVLITDSNYVVEAITRNIEG